MKITNLRVSNFRALKDVSVPLSSFVCFIGENNAGKSTLLHAMNRFSTGTSLTSTDFYEAGKEIRIEVSLTEIGDADLARLAEEHRSKIASIVKDGALTLVRLYSPDGKGKLKYRTRMPTEDRFTESNLDELLKGKKASAALAASVANVFPELSEEITSTSGVTAIREAIAALGKSLPDDRTVETDADLPSGFDNSVKAILPEVIYIPAVKDFKEDIKTTESAPFGKIVGILLRRLEPKLGDITAHFETLNKQLNVSKGADGQTTDARIDDLRLIEKTVQDYVQESFAKVAIRIHVPLPELKAVLSGAQVFANDGVDGLIDSKGDGLRRAIVFSVLRAYVELQRTLVADAMAVEPIYLLLFEEPELYLHPKAQHVLFDILSKFSKRHHVVVTTHSPTFFGPEATTSFIKVRKSNPTDGSKPFTAVHPVDLGDESAKNQFQIICYENNNIAFFADSVVLVEGDSDLIVLPHLAKLLNEKWDGITAALRFARVNGKTSISRYRKFFDRFMMRVAVVADLDTIVDGFEHLDPSDAAKRLRDQLIAELDKHIEESGGFSEPSNKRLKDQQGRGDRVAHWRHIRELEAKHNKGEVKFAELDEAIRGFFEWERKDQRLNTLRVSPNAEIAKLKQELLDNLRTRQVCILSKGTIDHYYPPEVAGQDKPTKAQDFCKRITQRDHAIALCPSTHKDAEGKLCSEFEAIFGAVFDNAQSHHTSPPQALSSS